MSAAEFAVIAIAAAGMGFCFGCAAVHWKNERSARRDREQEKQTEQYYRLQRLETRVQAIEARLP